MPDGSPIGTVLFSYLPEYIFHDETDDIFNYHSNMWESRTIGHIFRELGYEVHAVSFNDWDFLPTYSYDVVFDIHANLSRWESRLNPDIIKILHITGSDVYYSLMAELNRVQALITRRNARYKLKRVAPLMEDFRYSLHLADICTLLGNQYTLNTYPNELHHKFQTVRLSASDLGKNVKSSSKFVPEQREFLWFFGSGAVHKGLDLVLEVFAKNPQWTLNVVGNVIHEKDFMAIYQQELLETANIHHHGHLKPSSELFGEIISRCVSFIAPSCSEGTSSAVITCLNIGLLPIISYDTGVTLPNNSGFYLEENTIEEIEMYAQRIIEMQENELTERISLCQEFVANTYTRKNFYQDMKNAIESVVQK